MTLIMCHLYFFFNLSQVLNSDCCLFCFILEEKEDNLSFNLTPAVKYFSAAVTAQCPCHVFGSNSHGLNDFRFLLSYSYKSCIFSSLCICGKEN